jgi:DNA-binding NtrC family response regulator
VPVLTIEDEPLIATSIHKALGGSGGMSFDIAQSAAQAHHISRMRRPRIISSNARSKAGTGPTVLRINLRHSAEIPVILMASNPESCRIDIPVETLLSKSLAAEDVSQAFHRAIIG